MTKARVRRYRERHPDREKEYQRHKYHLERGNGHCEVCNYSLTFDVHHDGDNREEHILCPNCHALITRGIKTLDELKALHQGVTEGVTDYTELAIQALNGKFPSCPDGRYREIDADAV